MQPKRGEVNEDDLTGRLREADRKTKTVKEEEQERRSSEVKVSSIRERAKQRMGETGPTLGRNVGTNVVAGRSEQQRRDKKRR